MNNLKKIIKSVLSLLDKNYEKYYSRIYLDLPIGYLENLTKLKKNINFIDYETKGPSLPISFFIATNHGLLQYEDGKLKKTLAGKGFYGITKNDNKWYAFHKTGKHGRIISFSFYNGVAIDIKSVIWGLSRGVHQIDFIGERLFITDTYNNSILYCEISKDVGCAFWRKITKRTYPNGQLRNGRASENYNHFNSIFCDKQCIYLVAHNETYKTKKKSQIFKLDKNLKVIGLEKIEGSNCHNIYVENGKNMVCKSIEGEIELNENTIFSCDKFTRGISVSRDYYIFGGSDIVLDRTKRNNSNGCIYITNKHFELISKITIKGAQINEIRRIDCDDWGLSNSCQESPSDIVAGDPTQPPPSAYGLSL